MAAAIEGTPVDIDYTTSSGTDTYTAETASDRVVVLEIWAPDFFSLTFAPTMGAQAFTEGDFIEGPNNGHAGIWYIKDADIPSGSQIIDYGESGVFDTGHARIYTLSGVNQTTVGTFTSTTATTATPSLSYTGVTDGLGMAICFMDTNGSPTDDAAWTTDRTVTTPNDGFFSTFPSIPSGADTYDPTNASSKRWTIVAGVFGPVAVGGTTPKGPLGHPFHGPFAGPLAA